MHVGGGTGISAAPAKESKKTRNGGESQLATVATKPTRKRVSRRLRLRLTTSPSEV